ncbi:MAG: MFS transporter [Gemmatimonadetes bacterium]|nr:MAG: MFS transporter [Gemmatimonadota bacterium]
MGNPPPSLIPPDARQCHRPPAYIASVTVPRTINPFRVVLRHRNFRLFWIGQTLSLIGTWMQTMAQGWLALELTNSAFLVGLVATASSIPVLLFTMPAGAIVDRSDKLRIVRVAQAAFLLEASTLWALTVTDRMTIGWLLALAFIGGLISSIEIPARQAMMIDLVGRDDLPDAIALNSSGFNLARVVGPGIAAAVIARLGIAWCFFLNAASFVTVLAGLFMMRLPAFMPQRERASPWQGVVQVLRYIRDTREVRSLMIMVTVYSILGAPVLALMPVVAREMFGLGAGGYGLLLSFLGIGGLTGALGLAAVGNRFSRMRLLTVASMLWPALLMTFSFTRVPLVGYVLLLAIGCVMILNGAISNGLLQNIVPDELRGRIMAAYGLVVVGLSQVVGAFTGGVIAHAVGVATAIFATALLMAGYGVWAFFQRPELRRLGARTV